MSKVLIDLEQCRRVAEQIKRYGVPADKEDPLIDIGKSENTEMVYLIAVAISHQTTPLVGPALKGTVHGRKRAGWDYLRERLFAAANSDPEIVTPDWLARCQASDVLRLLWDEEEGDTVSGPEMRAELWRDIGEFHIKRGWRSIRVAYDQSEGRLVRQDRMGLAQVIPGMQSYADPVRKKLNFFLALMQNEGIWLYKDEERLGPPVDYHEQRGHFRTQMVKITDADLEKRIRLRQNITPEEDIEVRQAVHDAICSVAQIVGTRPATLHYYYWNIFRNCCSRDAPHCRNCVVNCGLPSRYRLGQGMQCLVSAVCPSAGLSADAMLVEPRLDKTTWQ